MVVLIHVVIKKNGLGAAGMMVVGTMGVVKNTRQIQKDKNVFFVTQQVTTSCSLLIPKLFASEVCSNKYRAIKEETIMQVFVWPGIDMLGHAILFLRCVHNDHTAKGSKF